MTPSSVSRSHSWYGFIDRSLSKYLDSGHLFKEFSLKFPRKYARNTQAENCTGDLVRHAKNCKECYDLFYQEDSKYCELGGAQASNIHDCTIAGFNMVNCYEQIGGLSCNDCSFGVYVSFNQNSYYLMNC